MFNLFAALKMLIAETGSSLGSIAFKVIRTDFIPRLEKSLKSGEGDTDKVQKALDSWQPYMEGKGESGEWEKIARSVLKFQSRRFKLGDTADDDIEQEAVIEFLTNPKVKAVFRSFDPIGGPEAFKKYWSDVVEKLTYRMARNMKRHGLEHHFGTRIEDAENPAVDDLAAPKDFSDIDAKVMRDIEAEMDQYVKKALAGKAAALMVYEKWMELAEEKGPDEITFSRDIEPQVIEELGKKGKENSHGTVSGAYQQMGRVIAKFFKEERDMPIPSRLKEHLRISKAESIKGLSVAERLAYSEYRRRLAAWVLGQ